MALTHIWGLPRIDISNRTLLELSQFGYRQPSFDNHREPIFTLVVTTIIHFYEGIDICFLIVLESIQSRGHRSSGEAETAVNDGSLLKLVQWSIKYENEAYAIVVF